VAIGVYIYADIHTLDADVCTGASTYPEYVFGHHPVNPYYVPFRALTVKSAPNLLVAGKSMAQTFLANAATRLHPTEFTSGCAAGAAAALMSTNKWTSTDMYHKVRSLQDILAGEHVGSPLTWTTSESTAKRSDPVRESITLKATWLPVQYNATSFESISSIVRQLKVEGITRVYVDVWNNGVAYFNSPVLRAVAGSDSIGNDLLLWTLLAASTVNIEVVAWFEYGLMASYDVLTTNFGTVASKRGWILGMTDGFYWMDGRISEVQQLMSGMLLDAQREYGPLGLKGVQLDDHFALPATLGGTTADMDAVMTAIHDEFRSYYPEGVLFSLSPATVEVALNTYSVDWVKWINSGFFTEVIPQIYRTNFVDFQKEFDYTNSLLTKASRQKWSASGVRCNGSGSPTSWEELSRMILYSSGNEVGVSVWYAQGVLELYPTEFQNIWK
jgi:uncharacterized lipoprotein YddW (UPF0748 family)